MAVRTINDPHSLFFNKEMELSLIGLQNAGKTSLVNVITTGTFCEDMIPTVGFNMRKVSKGKVTIKLWDLGGQVCHCTTPGSVDNHHCSHGFGSMWERYCRGVQAIVYVVDAADKESIETARGELHELLSKHSLDGIPLLVLGNKNDLPGALSTAELIDKLELKVCHEDA